MRREEYEHLPENWCEKEITMLRENTPHDHYALIALLFTIGVMEARITALEASLMGAGIPVLTRKD